MSVGLLKEPSREKGYRKDIDGIRAIAVLSVVFYHGGLSLCSGGFTGVDIFFVISGYLIGGQIFRDICDRSFSYVGFYFRRAKRILPAFYLVMAFTLAAAALLLAPQEAVEYGKSAFASVLSLGNIFFLRNLNYFRVANEFKPLLMTWSLGVEEQFYFVIPVCMILLARIHRRWAVVWMVLVSLVSFLVAWQGLSTHPDFVFYMLPARAWELGAGVLLAILEATYATRIGRRWVAELAGAAGMAAMLAPIFLYNRATPFPGLAALPSVVGAVLAVAARDSWINGRVLSLPAMTYVGRISYSLYLWHWPLLAFLRLITGRPTAPMLVGTVLLAVLLAAFSYRIVEQPFRHTRTPAARSLLRYALVSVVFLGVSASFFLTGGLPGRYPQLAREVIHEQNPCLADYGVRRLSRLPQCTGENPARRTVVLWGDSHASALAPALADKAARQGLNFVQYTKASCLPLVGAAKFQTDHPQLFAECVEFNTHALQAMAQDNSIATVVVAGLWSGQLESQDRLPLLRSSSAGRPLPTEADPGTVLLDTLSATVQTLRRPGRRVVLASDVPIFETDPAKKYFTQAIPLRAALDRLLHYPGGDGFGSAPNSVERGNQAAFGILSRVRSQQPDVALVNLEAPLCRTAEVCIYMDGDTLLFEDEQHLTRDGAELVLRDFEILPR